jgi:phosphoribosyl 1,2-cyclic phosphate phosphodiesterase
MRTGEGTGVPYARSGPSVFVHGPDVLIGTPEEVKGGKRLLIAPDEINGWVPLDWLRGADLAIPQVGVFEFHPIMGGRRIHEENPVLKAESTFEETLQIVDSLDARRTMLTHIEEMDELTHDDLQKFGHRQRVEGRNVEFAYDTLIVDV